MTLNGHEYNILTVCDTGALWITTPVQAWAKVEVLAKPCVMQVHYKITKTAQARAKGGGTGLTVCDGSAL